ncbi:MAG: RNA pseudouridine synthase [Clostridiales bacterium]|nr:RNA pseudouridine synthase [Clostridiales bacterium]
MLKVIFEDNHLLIVEKPPNLLTQGDATGDPCLFNMAKVYIKEKYQKPGEVYLGLTHRLDRPVGGLVALARTSKAASRLSDQLRTHAIRREYLAVVHGAEIAQSGERIDNLLDENGIVRVVPESTPGAKEAVLDWSTLGTCENRALLHITLQTGRKHQIRVQLANLGHPIVQDMRYGDDSPGEPIALWGAALTLTHPTKKEEMTFYSRPQGKAFAAFDAEIDKFLSEENR